MWHGGVKRGERVRSDADETIRYLQSELNKK